MSARGSEAVFWGPTTLLALAAGALLVRALLAIPAHVPLDPNEGWNAFHAVSAMAGQGLYPPAGDLMVNNYPPLSFYVVGALGKAVGDYIIAGRLISLISFLVVTAGIAWIPRAAGCGARSAFAAALFFAASVLISSDYVGMDDPQLLGHAVQIAGLLLLTRRRHLAAAALLAAGIFIKHNLLAMPLTASFWLLVENRREGFRFTAAGLGFCLLGLALSRWIVGSPFLPRLFSARAYSLANYQIAVRFLTFAALPIVTVGLSHFTPSFGRFCRCYGAIAMALGLAFAGGDGVDINIFFDATIALSLLIGLALERRPRLVALGAFLPLLLLFSLNFRADDFSSTSDLAGQARRDIAFLRSRPGPSLCGQLSLCYWAGKPAAVDVFNISEELRTGARDAAGLDKLIASGRFSVIEVGELDHFMGPGPRAALAERYRVDHADDMGIFLVPR